MKPLIAIISHGKSRMRDVIRETWVTKIPEGVDYKFFLGRVESFVAQPDEVCLDVDDTYNGLIEKVQAVSRWAFDHGYEQFLKCDDDVVVKPAELLASGFDQHDFVGSDNGDFHKDTCSTCGRNDCRQTTGKYITPWGFCYWVSRKGMALLYDASLPAHGRNDECWVAHVLGEQGISLFHDNRYFIHTGYNPEEPMPQEAPLDTQYVWKEVQHIVPRAGRLGRVRSVRERTLVPLTYPAPSGMSVLPNEAHRKDGWLVRSKFTEVQATPGTFAFCIHLVWKGYHCTPTEEVIAEFRKVYADPSIVWFDRRCFGGGSWREV
jgi:Galactosyltransferase